MKNTVAAFALALLLSPAGCDRTQRTPAQPHKVWTGHSFAVGEIRSCRLFRATKTEIGVTCLADRDREVAGQPFRLDDSDSDIAAQAARKKEIIGHTEILNVRFNGVSPTLNSIDTGSNEKGEYVDIEPEKLPTWYCQYTSNYELDCTRKDKQ